MRIKNKIFKALAIVMAVTMIVVSNVSTSFARDDASPAFSKAYQTLLNYVTENATYSDACRLCFLTSDAGLIEISADSDIICIYPDYESHNNYNVAICIFNSGGHELKCTTRSYIFIGRYEDSEFKTSYAEGVKNVNFDAKKFIKKYLKPIDSVFEYCKIGVTLSDFGIDYGADSTTNTEPQATSTPAPTSAPVPTSTPEPTSTPMPTPTAIPDTSTTAANDDPITVLLDGEKLEFDVEPRIVNDRTMVPMRAIFEKLGATVLWDEDTKTITSEHHSEKGGVEKDVEITLQIGNPTMYVKGTEYNKNSGEKALIDEEVSLDSPAFLAGERTLVPLRAISESFGSYVMWDGDTRTVVILSSLKSGIVAVEDFMYENLCEFVEEECEMNASGVHSFKFIYWSKKGEFKAYTTDDEAMGKTAVATFDIDETNSEYKTESARFTFYDDLSHSAEVSVEKADGTVETAEYIFDGSSYVLVSVSDSAITNEAAIVLTTAVGILSEDVVFSDEIFGSENLIALN